MIKRLLLLLAVALCSCTGGSQKFNESDFTQIFNGEDFTGWYFKIRSGDNEMAKKLYAVEDGMVHVFNDEFPDKYCLKGDNATHGLFYTEKEYSRFILRFDYKWGTKIANNYHQFQYDAGCYYHVVNDRIWPLGIEYQVRYNDSTNENHTGDFWIGELSPNIKWSSDANGRYLPQSEGGEVKPSRTGEHRAAASAPFHALDGEWNECEIIVMGNKYAIHKLNGEVVNVATDLGLDHGVIGLQSETAEIFYRNIRILELEDEMPIEEFLQK